MKVSSDFCIVNCTVTKGEARRVPGCRVFNILPSVGKIARKAALQVCFPYEGQLLKKKVLLLK